jgi:hypothetical protein
MVKSEEFNQFVKWLFIGNRGIIAENVRHQLSKVVKYNQLVATLWNRQSQLLIIDKYFMSIFKLEG